MATAKAAAKAPKEKPSQPAPQKSSSLDTPAFQRKAKSAAPATPPAPPAQANTVADAPSATVTPPTQAPAASLRAPRINEVRFVGRLAADPELKDLNGTKVANFRIAVNDGYFDKNHEWQKQVTWVPVAVFGQSADRVASTLHQGSPVLVEGRLRTSEWKNPKGEKRSMLRVDAYKVQSLAKGQSKGQEQEIGD